MNDNLTDPADILEKAADLIEAGGHTKHTLADSCGAFCAMGALNHAAWGSYEYPPLRLDWLTPQDSPYAASIHAVTRHLGLALLPGGDSELFGHQAEALVYWNNADERTPDEVVDAFRGAAKDLRNEAAPKL